jgi:hypothetical protein
MDEADGDEPLRRSPPMSDNAPLNELLARTGLTKCPTCGTPMTAESIGWNAGPEHDDVFPSVYIACRRCPKMPNGDFTKLKVIRVNGFAHSLDTAIQKANEAVG